MDILHISSWNEFVTRTSECDGWAFRGLPDADWQLYSSLSRYLHSYVSDKTLWRQREERALRIFRRKAHNYLPDPAVLADDVRCLALMQHHGAPTRMLDFTKSPFVAAFFALYKATRSAAVFALDTPTLWSAAPRGDATLKREAIDPRVQGNFERHFAGNGKEIIWVGEPEAMDRRLVAQSGTFVVPGVLDKPLDEIIRQYERGTPLIRKFVLPPAIRTEAMLSLYRMNITHATLFPDLDGLARSIGYELEITWPGYRDAGP
ncbi:FRG domain-containing protein [Pseudoduganella flava]|uniref:FRG domain-containing protein n=1 Tax=Pseudoduganella flava TaxID=871742 RepID=A0A562PCG2_9BURK|nr:FRG domain-containing protein [Pseudoduganella flava]QGZ40079.1 FRG domain-containing protein [Pseudoduganella flava]TWI42172.1 FRG domain-containing protein [Pseudoduganella flava]